MEIIDFIKDLRKKGANYYDVWLPIILRFNKEETVFIRLINPENISRSTYHRIIKYGIFTFSKYVKNYSLVKNYSGLTFYRNHDLLNDNSGDTKKIDKDLETVEPKFKDKVQIEEVKAEKTKPERKKAQEISYPNEIYESIIEFLNQSTGKNYKNNSVINRKFITQRLNDGFTLDDFRQVIAIKSSNWLGSKMEQFLRPETLFSNKFESYLNENVVSNIPNSNLKNTYDQVNIATELYNSQK